MDQWKVDGDNIDGQCHNSQAGCHLGGLEGGAGEGAAWVVCSAQRQQQCKLLELAGCLPDQPRTVCYPLQAHCGSPWKDLVRSTVFREECAENQTHCLIVRLASPQKILNTHFDMNPTSK